MTVTVLKYNGWGSLLQWLVSKFQCKESYRTGATLSYTIQAVRAQHCCPTLSYPYCQALTLLVDGSMVHNINVVIFLVAIL